MSETRIADVEPRWPCLNYETARGLFERLTTWAGTREVYYHLAPQEAVEAVLPLLEEYLRWNTPEEDE